MVSYLMAHGQMNLAEGLAHQLSDDRAADIARRAARQRERETRAAAARQEGQQPVVILVHHGEVTGRYATDRATRWALSPGKQR